MGPTLLLDKSALESLSMDESVWLDMFFGANITPLFYVETLADLEKSDKTGRSGEKIVADLAGKTPTNATFPNAHHHGIIIQDLMGNTPPMDTHQVPVSAGQAKRDRGGRLGMHIDEFPEQAALNRWFSGEFSDLERNYAKAWREALNSHDPTTTMAWVKNIVPTGRKFSSIEDVKAFTDEFVKGSGTEVLNFCMELLAVPEDLRPLIRKRYTQLGEPSLETFAPYTAFVLKVEIFYYLCLGSSFISKDRASNKADIAYLYYLPFCHVFVSKDNLHKRVARLFMEHGQRFVDADDLKKALKQADDHYSQFTSEIEEVGLMRYVGYPSPALNNLITELWDEFMRPDWRDIESERGIGKDGMPSDAELVAQLKKTHDEAVPVQGPVDTADIDYAMVSRMASVRRGKWRIMPPGIENEDPK